VSDHPPVPAPISTVAKPSRTVELVNDHDPPEPTLESTPVEAPRIVVPMDHHPPEPELSFRARVEPDGSGAEVSARARSRIGVIAVSCVLIVFFIVAGVVLVARSGAQREDPRRQNLGRCTERIERIERTERTCERDGS
jgi:hypothetical protein